MGLSGRKNRLTARVEQFDLEGNYIETFESSYEAFITTGIYRTSIINCCRGRRKNAGGFVWKYADEDE